MITNEYLIDYTTFCEHTVRVLKTNSDDKELVGYYAPDVQHIISPLCNPWIKNIIKTNSVSVNIIKSHPLRGTPIANMKGVKRIITPDRINLIELTLKAHIPFCQYCTPLIENISYDKIEIQNECYVTDLVELPRKKHKN